MLHQATMRQSRVFPAGFCPEDLRPYRLFYAPLDHNWKLAAGAIGAPTFVRATEATYVDAVDGKIKIAASGVPRFEKNGYLSEGQRTNRLFPSDDFGDGQWTNSNITVAANQTGVGGEANAAARLTATAGDATLINDTGVVSSAAFRGSLYIKRVTGTGDIDLTLDGGSTWTTVTVTAGFTILGVQQTLANPDFGIRIVTSGDAIDVQAVQVEAGTFPSSRIPTVAAAVTRNSDVLTWSNVANINAVRGTIYAETTLADITSFVVLCSLNDSSGSDVVRITTSGVGGDAGKVRLIVRSEFATVVSIIVPAGDDDWVRGEVKSVAATYAVNDYKLYTGGVFRVSDAFGALPVGLSDINIGHQVTTDPIFGKTKNFQIFSDDLSAFDVSRIA